MLRIFYASSQCSGSVRCLKRYGSWDTYPNLIDPDPTHPSAVVSKDNFLVHALLGESFHLVRSDLLMRQH
jgi:hypothetical protein